MKRVLFALLLAGAVCVTLSSQAQITIAIGDQGYYTRGASYVDGGYRYVWVPGHWNSMHTHWIHGHYARRGHVGVGVGVGVGIGVGNGGGIYIHP